MEKKESVYFKFEEKFLEDKELLSIVNCGDNHNLTIDEVKNRKVEILFTNSIISNKKEFLTDLICKTPNGFYLYLSTTVMEQRYMLKIYHKINDKGLVDLLIKSIQK